MSILKNSSIVIGGIVISNILAFIFHVYVGRVLGPIDYGIFGALIAIFTIAAVPTGAISTAAAKFTARFNYKNQKDKIHLLKRKLRKGIITYTLLVFIILVIFSKLIAGYIKIESIIPVLLLGVILFFFMIIYVGRGFLQGMKKFTTFSLNQIIESLSRLILVIAALFIGLKVNGTLIAYGLGYLIAFLFILPYLKQNKSGKTRKNTEEKISMRQIYGFIFLVLLFNLFIQGILNLPTIFIKHFLTAEFTGYWTAALTLARVTLYLTFGITIVMFPEVAEKTKKQEKKIVFKKALTLALLAAVGMAVIFWIFPGLLITLLYGEGFLGAVPILRWMGLVMILIGALQVSLNYWLAGKN